MYALIKRVAIVASIVATSFGCHDSRQRVLTTTVCTILKSPTLFENRAVLVRAFVESDGIHYTRLVDAGCPEQLIFVTWGGAGNNQRLAALIQMIFARAAHPGTLDKVIEGTFTGIVRLHRGTPPLIAIDLTDVTGIVVKTRPNSPF
jgi:hypothetical protein